MNILNQEINQTPSLEMVSSNCLLSTQHSYRQVLRTYENMHNQIWNNPFYSPAEIISDLGTNASEVLTVQEKLAEALNGLVSGCANCDHASYTKNEDGTVTLN